MQLCKPTPNLTIDQLGSAGRTMLAMITDDDSLLDSSAYRSNTKPAKVAVQSQPVVTHYINYAEVVAKPTLQQQQLERIYS